MAVIQLECDRCEATWQMGDRVPTAKIIELEQQHEC